MRKESVDRAEQTSLRLDALRTESLLKAQSDLEDLLRLREPYVMLFACSLLLFELYLGTAFLISCRTSCLLVFVQHA